MKSMKRTLSWFLISCTLAATCHADTVDITINGKLVPGTCNFVAGDDDQTVDLQPVTATEISAATGALLTKRTPFSIRMENCATGLRGVTFAFAGTVTTPNSVLLNTGTATGVGIEMSLNDGSDTVITPNTGFYQVAVDATKSAELKALAAYYHLPGAAVGAGTVTTLATVTVTFQ